MNEELTRIYKEDIHDRTNNISGDELGKNDDQRIEKVKKILNSEGRLEGIDYHHAALIFQHGTTTDDYKKAHELALKAVDLGDETARWLAAASLDRSLLSAGKAQKYGTQFKQNELGEWELALPIEPSTTDIERKEWNVPPLSEALDVFKRKYNL